MKTVVFLHEIVGAVFVPVEYPYVYQLGHPSSPSNFRCIPMHRAMKLARRRQRMRDVLHARMSAIGPKRTSASAPHMSAIGGKAGHAILRCKCPLMTQSGHWFLFSRAHKVSASDIKTVNASDTNSRPIGIIFFELSEARHIAAHRFSLVSGP